MWFCRSPWTCPHTPKGGELPTALLDATSQRNHTVLVHHRYQPYASFTVKYTFELGGNCVTADYGATNIPGTISVLNTVRLFPILRWLFPGPIFASIFSGVKISGFAVQSPVSSTLGALSVSLGPFANDPAQATYSDPGNYWIIGLGTQRIISRAALYDFVLAAQASQPARTHALEQRSIGRALRPLRFRFRRAGPKVEDKYDWAIVSGPGQTQLYILTRDVARFESDYEASVLAMVEQMGFTTFLNKPRPTSQEGCRYDLEE